MKPTTLLPLLSLGSLALALPSPDRAMSEQNPSEDIKWPAPKGMTVTEASRKCGDQAQLSCCQKASKAGDTTNVHEGGGQLSGVLGAGSASEGASLFSQCSKLDAQGMYFFIWALGGVLCTCERWLG